MLTLLLLWASCGSTMVPATVLPYGSVMGLAMPVFALINIGFIVLWLLFEWRAVWLPVLGMLPVYGFLLDYCPLNLSSGYLRSEFGVDSLSVRSAGDGTYRVGTFNVFNWACKDSTDGEWNFCLLARTLDADILCLQEAGGMPVAARAVLDSLGYDIRELCGRTICTRLTFIGDSLHVGTTGSGNGYHAWRMTDGNDTLLVIDCHLESTRIAPEDKKNFSESLSQRKRDELRSSGKIVLSHLLTAMDTHQAETDSLCQFIVSHSGESILLCGDLNDTPISYTCQNISKYLTSAFRESGCGLGWTYDTPGFWGRIDHIFYTSDWESTETYVERRYRSSDHFPILTTIRKK